MPFFGPRPECCCGIQIETGAKVLAVLRIIGNVFSLIPSPIVDKNGRVIAWVNDNTQTYLGIARIILDIIACILVFVAIRKRKGGLMIPVIVITVLKMIVVVVTAIVSGLIPVIVVATVIVLLIDLWILQVYVNCKLYIESRVHPSPQSYPTVTVASGVAPYPPVQTTPYPSGGPPYPQNPPYPPPQGMYPPISASAPSAPPHGDKGNHL